MTVVLKKIRNVIADQIAALIYSRPAMEPSFIKVGHILMGCPPFDTLYRQSFDGLSERLTQRDDNRRYREIVVEGVKIVFDVSDFTVKSLYFQGRAYEPETTKFLRSHLPLGATFVDIGTNQGFFAMLAGKLVGVAGHVYGFEPNPPVREQLVRHRKLNALEDVVSISELALSDFTGEADLYISTCSTNSGLSSLNPSEFALEHGLLAREMKTTVRVDTFDSWAGSQQLGEITVMKIDVEDAEEGVVRGMKETLSANPPRWIVCETKWEGPTSRLLQGYGYKTSLLEGNRDGWCNVLFSRE